MGGGIRQKGVSLLQAKYVACAMAAVPRFLLFSLIAISSLFIFQYQAHAYVNVTVHGDISLTATEAAFTAGRMNSTGHPISYNCNENWTIYVRSLDPDLGLSDDGQYTKPLSDLRWKRSAASTYNIMTTTDAFVRSGSNNNGSFNVDYRFRLAWANDRKGTYGATIQYTITAT
jgi:hypothetical protein